MYDVNEYDELYLYMGVDSSCVCWDNWDKVSTSLYIWSNIYIYIYMCMYVYMYQYLCVGDPIAKLYMKKSNEYIERK